MRRQVRSITLLLGEVICVRKREPETLQVSIGDAVLINPATNDGGLPNGWVYSCLLTNLSRIALPKE
jgi:hypothetical protein